MNNKGFSLIELITTFALTSVIVFLLINVVMIIKNVYVTSSIKTELLINQSTLSNIMNSKIKKNNLKNYQTCSDEDFCFEFIYKDNTSDKLIITDNFIKYGNYVYKLIKGSKVVNTYITKEYIENMPAGLNDSIFIIQIDIENETFKGENFGVNIIYPYDSRILEL